MLCHRQQVNYSYINTNNYIESWHNTLKEYFFKDKQQRRLDSVIHTLTKKTVPYFQQMCVRHIVQVGRMTPGRKKALIARTAVQNHIDRTQAMIRLKGVAEGQETVGCGGSTDPSSPQHSIQWRIASMVSLGVAHERESPNEIVCLTKSTSRAPQ